jgi:endothelin-converting enzyme/putative endopeptidase
MRKMMVPMLLTLSCASQQLARTPVQEIVDAGVVKKFVADLRKPMPDGLAEEALDVTADPCSDFYQYACGGWMAKTEIPADRSSTSRGFLMIVERNELALKAILEDAAAKKLPAGTPFSTQMGDVYSTCMDEAALETSLPEVKKFVQSMTRVGNAKELAKTLGDLHAIAISPFFASGSMQDLKQPNEVIVGLSQGGLGLPDRDYYLEDNEKMKAVRAAYLAFVEQMFGLYGESPEAAKRSANAVMSVETRLAKVSMSRVEMRSPEKLYNRIERLGLQEKAGGFDWDTYLTALGAKKAQAINVTSVRFFEELSAIAKDTTAEVLRPYLTWSVIQALELALPSVFQKEAFSFASKNFTGAKEDRLRWKKCVDFVDSDLGEALGREFARRHFPEESKVRTNEMVKALQAAFEKNLETLPWMDAETRAAAMVKVEKMVSNNKIGYPAAWRDYSALKSDRASFLKNVVAGARFETARNLAKVGRPVDRSEWLMSAPTVNAYYEPQKNEIVFPAGILQPPFFSAAASDAVNFGAMGMIVGHEITHGFDDEGRKFAADGSLKDWWSEASGKAFVERAECVKKQFDGYTAIGDLKVKGDLTLGENVADLGGIKLSHAAMREWYAKKGEIDGGKHRYNHSQQFFLGLGQSWCTKMRKEMAQMRVTTDPHAPAFLRVLGPVGNLDAFKEAFMCSDKDKMIRTGASRCSVW